MSKVYFADIKKLNRVSLLNKTAELFDNLGVSSLIKTNDLVALKTSFGELGNAAYLRSVYIRKIIDKVRACKGNPFVTDANTIYIGQRSNAVSHIKNAAYNGFSMATLDAPVIIADGLLGMDYKEIKIDQKYFQTVKIASAIAESNCLIAMTHFKGHEMTGFGGAIKNIGMGSGARPGKQNMHSDVKPIVDSHKCIVCKECIKYCPQVGAICFHKTTKKAIINKEICIGCGRCVAACRHDAITISWDSSPKLIQEKMAEYALGVVSTKGKKIAYFNFLFDISPDCDCWPHNDAPITDDIGILASRDPVAIDQASIDLIGSEKFLNIYPHIKEYTQLNYAQNIGLGTKKYDLIHI